MKEYCGAEQEMSIVSGEGSIGTKTLKNRLNGFDEGNWGNAKKWIEDGGSFYGDFNGETPEFCSPLIEIKKGCAGELKDSIVEQRAMAVEISQGGGADVLTTHYSVGVNDGIGDEITQVAINTVGPMYDLLLSNSGSSGFMWRPRSGRFELCGDYLADTEQLEAGAAFLIGTTKGIERMLKEKKGDVDKVYHEVPLMMEDVELRPASYRNGYEIDSGYENNVISKGSEAEIKTNKGKKDVLEIFDTYLDFFGEDIKKVATKEEMELLKKYASGKKKTEIDQSLGGDSYSWIDAKYIQKKTGKKPKDVIEEYNPHGAAVVFADAAKNREKSFEQGAYRVKRETKYMDWGAISYTLKAEEEVEKQPGFLKKAWYRLRGKAEPGPEKVFVTRGKQDISVELQEMEKFFSLEEEIAASNPRKYFERAGKRYGGQ